MTYKDEKELFTGKGNGISFEKFDEMVDSWGRRKYGEKNATQLWRNELVDLEVLDLSDCQLVYDVLCSRGSGKYACRYPLRYREVLD